MQWPTAAPMPMPLPRYTPLVDRWAAEIRSGRLAPGTRLPTHRQLAASEGVGLVTASRVYAELAAMGLVSGETGRGTFVRETALPRGHGLGLGDRPIADDVVDLTFSMPSVPGQAELLRAALRQLAAGGDLDALLRYHPQGGRPHERAAVARHLARRALPVAPEQVMLVDGAQHGLAVTTMALLRPGDVVATDALTYPGFKLLADTQHLTLAAIPSAGQGPDLAALDALCRRRRVQAVYTMPTVHNPLGWVMDDGARRALVEIARRHDLLIIEDAAYAFLDAAAPPALAALAPETTVHVSGFSKGVATGLRVGHVVAPRKWAGRIERAIRATTWNTPGVMTAITCGWLDDGTVDRLEARKREDATARQVLVADVFGDLPRVAHPGSYLVWLPLGEEVRADQVAADLLRDGVSVSTAEPFATTAHVPHALRLALGSVELAVLRPALEKVARAIRGRSL